MATPSADRAWTNKKRNGGRRFWTRETTPDHKPVTINERDLAVLRHLFEHRLTNTRLLHKQLGGSYRALSRRLRQLSLDGYLERPTAQIHYYKQGGGSDCMVFALSTKGARTLKQKGDTPFARNLSAKNKTVRQPFIDHTVATTRFMTDLAMSCRKRPNTHLLLPDAVRARAPLKTRQDKRQTMGWHVQVRVGDKQKHLAVIPDKMFSLLDSDSDEVSHFCLETDRASMPVISNNIDRSSILRKILAYREVFRTRAHERVFGWANMRVILETTTSDHADTIKQCIRDVYGTHKTGMFLVATERQTTDQDLLAHSFETAFGDKVRLV